MVANICNHNYLGGRVQRIKVQGQSGQKISETPAISTKNWAWWGAPVIPTTWEVLIEGSWSRHVKGYLKHN
jgi:hypothetical protein